MATTHDLRRRNVGGENLSSQELSMATSTPAFVENRIQTRHLNKMQEPKFDYDDILLVPKPLTTIKSRYSDDEVIPYYSDELGNSKLPIFTAPMDSVVNHHNAYVFQTNKINVVMPRTETKNGVLFSTFPSYGLKETPHSDLKFALIDVANGHMASVLDWCEKAKKANPKLKIMAGNIANPETYAIYCGSGVVDYARIGIGNGNGCLTTQQTGVGYPMGSLIEECYKIKQSLGTKVKIVADGGIKKPSDIIKALAIGADYVMIGSLFSKTIESCAPNYFGGIRIGPDTASFLYRKGFRIKKQFRGMSTKGAQKALGNTVLKTSEGVTRIYDVEYTVEQFVKNVDSYLRSTMSYNGAKTLGDFIGKMDYVTITNNAFNRFNK